MKKGHKAPGNRLIAGTLERIADLLEAKEENAFRVASYRRAARSIGMTRSPVARFAKSHGPDGLRKISGVGEKLAGLVTEFVATGKIALLRELESEKPAPRKSPPKKKRHAVQDHRTTKASRPAPGADVILDVDAEYRKRADAGTLKMIAPKKLNPEGKAWLPILSTSRGRWAFTVMFSNTARAHELGTTHDWVVVYYQAASDEEQCTVVTERRGALAGKRVIRGREQECAEYYNG